MGFSDPWTLEVAEEQRKESGLQAGEVARGRGSSDLSHWLIVLGLTEAGLVVVVPGSTKSPPVQD